MIYIRRTEAVRASRIPIVTSGYFFENLMFLYDATQLVVGGGGLPPPAEPRIEKRSGTGKPRGGSMIGKYE